MKIQYEEREFRPESLAIIRQADEIIDEYTGQGFNLTLRQVYYQFVARGLLPNSQKSYKRLGVIISNGRLAGLISWKGIEDRLRKEESLAHWSNPAEILESAAASYRIDTRATQPQRVEVWIEKDALSEIAQKASEGWDVTWFACRGYVSQSAMWRAAERFLDDGRPGLIIHLGDHDPSGIDMTRDIENRMCDTFGADVEVRRIALNMTQVRKYSPPPNPAKLSDSRAAEYVARYGCDSWELDALEPSVLVALIEDEIAGVTDMDALEVERSREESEREELLGLVERVSGLRGG